jgi:polyferredoxin
VGTQNTWRTVRITVSSVSCILISWIFLDITNRIPPSWIATITTLQFGPALIATMSSIGFTAIGLLFITLLTLLFGRIYCSHLCPLGTLQDIIIWFRKKNYKHRSFPFHKTNYFVHYSVTVLTIIATVGGSALLLDLFEPFSNYGRMVSSLVRPLFISLNNIVAMLITSTSLFGVAEIPLHGYTVWNVAIPLVFLLILIGLSVWRGRLFCNLLCPVGGILSLLSRFSLYKMQNASAADYVNGSAARNVSTAKKEQSIPPPVWDVLTALVLARPMEWDIYFNGVLSRHPRVQKKKGVTDEFFCFPSLRY